MFARGEQAERVVRVINDLARSSQPITRFSVNDLGHVFWRQAGVARFIAALDGELEFPASETG